MSDQKEKTKEYWDKFYQEGATSTNNNNNNNNNTVVPQNTKVSDINHQSSIKIC